MLFNEVTRRFIQNYSYMLRTINRGRSLSSNTTLYPLQSRKLLKVAGTEASVFLQGLITNDMKHFQDSSKSLYSMFLNNKGRVLFDTLIFKSVNDEGFLLECDKNVIKSLEKHLKMFKLKRQINIEDISHNLRLWVLFTDSNKDDFVKTDQDIQIFKDPRVADLGFRILAPTSLEGAELAIKLGKDVVTESNEEGYKYQRYKLGVGEGIEDLAPGTTFPLEVNCDYLHGVSFNKGCYIGQELTARVHHTGVVRKRIMPIKFKEEVKETIEKDTSIVASNNPKSNLGKFKGVVKDFGIGLVRIKEATDAKELKIGTYSAEVVKPAWWPIEAPKEIVSLKPE